MNISRKSWLVRFLARTAPIRQVRSSFEKESFYSISGKGKWPLIPAVLRSGMRWIRGKGGCVCLSLWECVTLGRSGNTGGNKSYRPVPWRKLGRMQSNNPLSETEVPVAFQEELYSSNLKSLSWILLFILWSCVIHTGLEYLHYYRGSWDEDAFEMFLIWFSHLV